VRHSRITTNFMFTSYHFRAKINLRARPEVRVRTPNRWKQPAKRCRWAAGANVSTGAETAASRSAHAPFGKSAEAINFQG